jgi:hypothetical protein
MGYRRDGGRKGWDGLFFGHLSRQLAWDDVEGFGENVK